MPGSISNGSERMRYSLPGTRRLNVMRQYVRLLIGLIVVCVGCDFIVEQVPVFATSIMHMSKNVYAHYYLVQIVQRQPMFFWPVAGILLASGFLILLVVDRLLRQTKLPADIPFTGPNVSMQTVVMPVIQSQADRSRGLPERSEGVPGATDFFGRSIEQQQVRARLTRGLAAIVGIAGIGKSALAGEVLSTLAEERQYADGVIVMRADGLSGGTHGALFLLRAILAAFGAFPEETDAESLADLTYTQLAGKSALVLLDNVEAGLDLAALLYPLRLAGIAVLMTTRHTLPSDVVPGGAVIELHALPGDEARRFFAQYAGLPAEIHAVDRIVKALGSNTLALQLMAAYAANSQIDIFTLAGQIEDNPQLLSIAADPGQGLAAIFAHCIEALPRELQLFFSALAVFPAPDFGWRAAIAAGAALSLNAETSNDALTNFSQRALVRVTCDATMSASGDRERIRMHPLLKGYLSERFADLSIDQQHHIAHVVAIWQGEYAETVPDADLIPDLANIERAIDWAHTEGEDQIVARITTRMSDFWQGRNATTEPKRYLPWAIEAAQRLVDTTGLVVDHYRLSKLAQAYGDLLHRLGDPVQAAQHYEQSFAIDQELANTFNQGVDLNELGDLLRQQGDLVGAQRKYEQYLAIMQPFHDTRITGKVLSKLGDVLAQQGDLIRARQ